MTLATGTSAASRRPFKILLVNPPFTGLGSGMSGHGGKAAPLNLGYLAAYARDRDPGFEFRILDAENLEVGYQGVTSQLTDYRPDLVAITFPTPAYAQVVETTRRVKQFGQVPVVVGGPHPSAFPTDILKEIPSVDVAVPGEGEVVFLNLIRAIRDGGSLSNVNGIAYRDGCTVRRTAPERLIEDLDTIPFPARDLLPTHVYYSPATKRVSGRLAGNMITSRGCPYDCTYCESKVVWTRKSRMRSVGNVCDEIETCVARFGIGEINFHDDILPMRRDRTIELCREMVRRKLDVRWVCMSRVNFIWEDVLIEMKKAGCRRIMFGLESGSNIILNNIKKATTIEQAYEAVAICKKVGIETMGSFMIGNIGETEETVRQSIDLAKELDLDVASFFVTIPFPGTDLYKQAVVLGYMAPQTNWEQFAVVGKSLGPLNLPGLTAEQMQYWQARALREFYLRPEAIARRLANIRSLEEVVSLSRGVRLLWDMSTNAVKQRLKRA